MVIILLMSLIPFLYMLVNRLAVDSFLLELVDGNYLAFLEKYRENLITSRKRERAVTTLVSLFLSSSLTVDELHPIFTLCISLFGSFSIFTAKLIRLEIITFSFFEYFGLFLNHPSKSHFLVAVVGLTALISHCFVYLVLFSSVRTEGFVLLAGLESNVMPALCVALVLAELVAVCYIYGSTRFFSNVQTMAMSKLIALLNFVFGDAWDFDRGDRLMLIVVLLPIPICALYRVRFAKLFLPSNPVFPKCVALPLWVLRSRPKENPID
ncbi:unnamed protein product [Heligmosomoides polygyrus]|uniref:GPI ethanolamine phosphate transferase 3 n=1 Tax=Heligmosomoides polygyrus TaxID=6339 RepID=A0A3P8BHR2_HELPZ|nr:unnamed protein product [Heligmosomoides polygyrus]